MMFGYDHFNYTIQFLSVENEDMPLIMDGSVNVVYTMKKLGKLTEHEARELREWYNRSRCVIISPKGLTAQQLGWLIPDPTNHFQKLRWRPMLLLTTTPEEEQLTSALNKRLPPVLDLNEKGDSVLLRRAKAILRSGMEPAWNNARQFSDRTWDAGWWLLDMEADGLRPESDHITVLRLAYMEGFKLQETKEIYIRTGRPIPPGVERLTGVTGQQLEKHGIPLEKAVAQLKSLSAKAPFLLDGHQFHVPFLRRAFSQCGLEFDLPCLYLSGIASCIFGYALERRTDKLLEKIPVPPLESEPQEPWLRKLYRLAMAVFHELDSRYKADQADYLELFYLEPKVLDQNWGDADD